MIGLSRIDDKIIYSRYFNFVECFDSTSFATFYVLIKTLESLLSRSSQQNDHNSRYPCKPRENSLLSSFSLGEDH